MIEEYVKTLFLSYCYLPVTIIVLILFGVSLYLFISIKTEDKSDVKINKKNTGIALLSISVLIFVIESIYIISSIPSQASFMSEAYLSSKNPKDKCIVF